MNEPLARTRGGVHAAVRHDSAVGHVTGAARYLDDVPTEPSTLEAALVLSPHPHARICRIDLSPALAAPGVVAAITAADIPGKNDIAPIRSDEPALAAGIVEYEGQPVAAIAAATFDQARAAARLVEIVYEPLPAVLSIEEAMARESFVSPPQMMTRGEVDPALAGAPHRLSGEVRCGGQDHFYLEGQIALAVPGEDGDMQVWSSTQHPTEVQHGVAHLLGLPFNAVTVEVRRMGGAFGGKESQATIIAGIAAVLAVKSRRPVKLRLPRDDDMRATGKRHPFLIRYDVGFDGEGRIHGARSHAGRRRRQRRRSHPGGTDTRAVPCRQLLLPSQRAFSRPGVQNQHCLQYGLSRLWRTARHACDRNDHRSGRPPTRPSRSRRPAAEFLRHRPQ